MKNLFLLKSNIFYLILLIPVFVFAQNNLNQTGTGFVETDGSSSNYEFKATIGESIVGSAESSNFKLDQGKTWAPIYCPPGTTWNGSSCVSNNTSSTGSGSGGGVSLNTEAIFSGRAFPNSRVQILKDGQIIATTVAGPDARFNVSVKGFSEGSHNFSILGIDSSFATSIPIIYNLNITKGVTTSVSGIYIAPTIDVDKRVVKQGENISIFGQTTPESPVIISVHSPVEFFRETGSDEEGIFLYNFDTSILNKGNHEAKAKSLTSGEISDFGKIASFEVGDVTILKEENLSCDGKGDINNDCRVNLVDLSIAAFWYKKELSGDILNAELYSLNGDGIINIVDLSIMTFYWTG